MTVKDKLAQLLACRRKGNPKIKGLGFRFQGLGSGFRFQCLGFRVQGLGFRVSGLGMKLDCPLCEG